jgi:hypothetical protein
MTVYAPWGASRNIVGQMRGGRDIDVPWLIPLDLVISLGIEIRRGLLGYHTQPGLSSDKTIVKSSGCQADQRGYGKPDQA